MVQMKQDEDIPQTIFASVFDHEDSNRNASMNPAFDESPTKVASSNESGGNDVELCPSQRIHFQSCIRIRPFLPGDSEYSVYQDDSNDIHVLEVQPASVSAKEKNVDILLLKPKPTSNLPKSKSRASSNSSVEQFPFDTILDTTSTQLDVFNRIARPIVQHAAHNNNDNTKIRHDVLLSFGISNSGKTHTLIGNHYGPQQPQQQPNSDSNTDTDAQQKDGLVPRILQEYFHEAAKQQNIHDQDFVPPYLELSMMHVHNDRVYDLLSVDEKNQNLNKNKNRIRVIYSSATQTFETNPKPTELTCHSIGETMHYFTSAMENIHVKPTHLNRAGSSRGHTLISLTFASKHKMTIVDMAGMERVKTSQVVGSALKESIAINETISAILQLLRVLKYNSNLAKMSKIKGDDGNGTSDKENSASRSNGNAAAAAGTSRNILSTPRSIKKYGRKLGATPKATTEKAPPTPKVVPYRQCTLTMLLQPLFSGCSNHSNSNSKESVQTNVTLLLSVYPGVNDYAEKRNLLKQIHALRGLSVPIPPTSTTKTTTTTTTTTTASTTNTPFSSSKQSTHHNPRTSSSPYTAYTDSPMTSSSPQRYNNNQYYQDNHNGNDDSNEDEDDYSQYDEHPVPVPAHALSSQMMAELDESIPQNTKSVKEENSNSNSSPYWKRMTKKTKSPLKKLFKNTPPKPPNPSQDYEHINKKLKLDIQTLREENRALMEQNAQLQQTCHELRHKNQSLENRLKSQRNLRKALQDNDDDDDDENKAAPWAHVLLPLPLQHYIEKDLKDCNETYDTIRTGGGAAKYPFLLHVPNQLLDEDNEKYSTKHMNPFASDNFNNETECAVVEYGKAVQGKDVEREQEKEQHRKNFNVADEKYDPEGSSALVGLVNAIPKKNRRESSVFDPYYEFN